MDERSDVDYAGLALSIASASLAEDGLLRLQVTGVSMRPVLSPGDVVLVCRVKADDLRRGDILTVLTPTGPLTHRLVRITPSGFQTKGDACRQMDAPFPIDRVVGIVVSVERAGITIMDYSQARWRFLHPITGLVSLGEGWLFATLKKIGQRIFPAGLPAWSRFAARLLSLPFRAIVFLLQCGLGRLFS